MHRRVGSYQPKHREAAHALSTSFNVGFLAHAGDMFWLLICISQYWVVQIGSLINYFWGITITHLHDWRRITLLTRFFVKMDNGDRNVDHHHVFTTSQAAGAMYEGYALCTSHQGS